MASLTRSFALLGLLGCTLLFSVPAQAECGGGQHCVAVAQGDARPAHGSPLVGPPLAFGDQPAGTRSATRTLRVGAITGPAGTRATLDAIVLGGANASDFAIDASTCTTGSPSLLHDGGGEAQLANTCTISVSFRPAAVGAKNATLDVRTAHVTRTVPLTGTATASVAGPGAAPAALDVQLNTPATIDLGPFVTGGATGVAIVSAPAHGTATVDGTRVTYTPARDYFGPDSFSYAAFNAAGSSAPALVSVTVGGRPDPSRDPDVAGLLAAQSHAARRFAQAQVANVQQRLEGLRSAGGAATGGGSTALPRQLASALASAAFTGALAPQASEASTGLWLAGNLEFGRSGASGQDVRRRFRTDGVSIGVDRRLQQDLLVGAALGFAEDSTDIGTRGTTSRSRGTSATVYGSFQPAPGRFVDALLGWGRLTHDSERFVPALGEFASARDRRSEQLFGSITGGMQLQRGEVELSPYARLDLAVHRFDDATETGAGGNALRYFGHTQRTVQVAAGLRAEARHPTRLGLGLPRLRLELRHALEGGRDMSLSFADQVGGPVYTLAPPRFDRTSVLLGVGTDFVLRNGLALGLDYALQRSTQGDRSYGVRAVLRQDLDARPTSSGRETYLPLASPVQVEAGYHWDDNLTRASDAGDRLSDHVFSLGVSRTSTIPLATHVRAVVTGFVNGERPYRHEGLERLSIGARGELQYRSSGAFGVPIFALFARAQHDEYNSALRSGQRYTLGLSARQSWTDRIDAFAALSWNRREARHAVFDGRDWGARFQLDYGLGRAGLLYFGPEYRRGDTVSTASAGAGAYAAAARAWAPDDAFDRPGLTAWRLEGRTVIWTLGYNLPLGTRDSIDFSWRHVESTPFMPAAAAALYGSGPRYRANQYSLFYLLRF